MKKTAALLFCFLMISVRVFAFPIGEGDRNEEVYNLQVALIASEMLDDEADGEFGPNTKNAVIKAQKHFEFEETGAVGYGLYYTILEYATKKGDAKNVQEGDEIRIGSKGPGVKELQKSLKKLGYYYGGIDGEAGAHTATAIAKFQRKSGIHATGIADAATYKALRNLLGGKSESKTETKGKFKGKKTMTMQATAYSPEDHGLNKHTATGKKLKRGIVAVDPKVIPLGTRVYIEGYGEATAEDVGSKIKGHMIDIAFNTHKEAINFGRREVKVTILD